MNTRAAAWFAAIILFGAGLWLSIDGWQKKWNLKGIAFRLGGAVALVAGGYSFLVAAKR